VLFEQRLGADDGGFHEAASGLARPPEEA